MSSVCLSCVSAFCARGSRHRRTEKQQERHGTSRLYIISKCVFAKLRSPARFKKALAHPYPGMCLRVSIGMCPRSATQELCISAAALLASEETYRRRKEY